MALCHAHTWPCHGLCRDIMPSPMPHLVTIQSNHPACQAASGHDTIYCIATQSFSISNLLLSRYKICIVTLPSSVTLNLSRYNKLYRDTLLQWPASAPLLSRYNLLYCDTISQPSSLPCHDTIQLYRDLLPGQTAHPIAIHVNPATLCWNTIP